MNKKIFAIFFALILTKSSFAQAVETYLVEQASDVYNQAHQKVEKGQKISTKEVLSSESPTGFIQLKWDEGQVALKGKFKFDLEQYQPNKPSAVLNILYGTARSLFHKSAPDHDFHVRTPMGMVGVRGTDFLTTFNLLLSETEVICFQSEIEMSNVQKKQTVFIKQGQWGGFGGRFGDLKKPIQLSADALKDFDASLKFK